MNCSICQSGKTELKFYISKTHQVFRCLNCETESLFPQLNDKELDTLYSENYYKAWGLQGQEENDVTRQMKIETFQLRLNLISQYKKNGAVLDVGCATGYFLETAKIKGFECYGIDFSEYSSAITKKKFGDKNIFKGTIEQCDFENKKFDVIAMSDLIEHVRVPVETLSKAAALLKDDGIILIMTPDTSSISRSIMGKRWTHYKAEHFFYFNCRSITYVANQSKLVVDHFERAKKALNIAYLHTQFTVYKHWLFTPLIKMLYKILPKTLITKNFYISIGEMVVILKKDKVFH